MTAGTNRESRASLRPSPITLVVLFHLIVALYGVLAVFVPWWRTRQFKKEVENLPGYVRLSTPESWLDRRLRRLAPLLQRVVDVSVPGVPVDDEFVIRAASVGELESLHVGGADITDGGAKALSSEQDLQSVWLNGTAVSDRSIATLAQLPELRSLDVTSIQDLFSDPAFAALARSRSLKYLTIGPVSLSQQGAADLAQVRTLESLRIVGGRVDGAAVPQLGHMTGLRTLSLDAEIEPDTNPLPLLRRLTQLETLSLHAPAIDDLAARDLCRFGELKSLNLSGTSVGDEMIRRLAETDYPRRSLGDLNLNGTGVTDACLYDLAQLPHLKNVSVRNTEFSETAAAALCRLSPRLKVQYTDGHGWSLEMTWDRVYVATDGMMEWPE